MRASALIAALAAVGGGMSAVTKEEKRLLRHQQAELDLRKKATPKPKLPGSKACGCGRTISGNKDLCGACAKKAGLWK
jgi:hypothetical protein